MFVEILQIIFGGLIVGFASSVTVGPVAVLCIQRTLSKGYLSGLASGLGIAFADTLMAIFSLTVYALLKSTIDQYNTLIQIAGGVIVIIIGVFIIFKNPVPQIRKNRTGQTRLWQDFGSMVGFTLANFVVIIPYILAFFTMFNIDIERESNRTGAEPRVEVVEQHSNEVPLMLNSGDSDEQSTVEVPYTQSFYYFDNEQNPLSIYTQPSNVINEADSVPATKDIEQGESQAAPTTKAADASTFSWRYIANLAFIMLGFWMGAVMWWFIITGLISLLRRGFRPRHILTLNRVAGGIITLLGVYTLISVLIG